MNQKHVDTRHPQTMTGGAPATTGNQASTPADITKPQTTGNLSKSAIPDGDGISNTISSGQTKSDKA